MKTDELIDLLGANLDPVKEGQPRNALLIALAAGGIAAVCLMLAIFGVPTDALGEHQPFGLKLMTLAVTLGLAAAGIGFLARAAHPGKSGRMPLLIVALLFAAILSVGVAALMLAHPAAWREMIFGPQWALCLMCIPLFAAAPFVSLIWALRKGAPTNLARTGAMIGLVAGALGAAVFAVHHPGGSVLFMAIWYGGPVLLCAVIGALLGPRLLRW